MEKSGQVEFSERFAELRELRDSLVLDRQDADKVHRLREEIMETFLESPEKILRFYQGAYLRYKESTEPTSAEASRPPLHAAETIEEANDFFREFGSFVLAYARGQQSEDSPLLMHIVTEYPEEVAEEIVEPTKPEATSPAAVQESVAAPEEQPYTPWVVRNTVTNERTPLPDELTEAVLAVLCENETPLDSEELREQVFDWSLGEINVDAKDITPVIEWIDARITAESGPHLAITDKEKGRWKKYLLEGRDIIEWEAPGIPQTSAVETEVKEGEADEAVLEEVEVVDTSDTLNLLERSILSYAQSGEPFRMEELRKAIPGLRDMPKDEYSDFKQQFEQIREHIVDFLESQGIKADWELSGKARGRNYRLVMKTSRELVKKKAGKTTENVPVTELPAPETSAPKITIETIAEQMEDIIADNINISRAGLFAKLDINDPDIQQQIIDSGFPELQRRLVAKGKQLVSSKPNGDGDNKDKRYKIEQIPAKSETAEEAVEWRFGPNRQSITDGKNTYKLSDAETAVAECLGKGNVPFKVIAQRAKKRYPHITRTQLKDALESLCDKSDLIATRRADRGGAKQQYMVKRKKRR